MDKDGFIYRPAEGAALADFDPKYTGGFTDEGEARDWMEGAAGDIAKYQDMLMAHGDYGLLVLFQAMDGAGKDATIKHVMSAADPQGCEVKLFKEATEKEARHDYLWRAVLALPARGQIGIFNRSYYENVLAERVHPEKLERQKLPREALGDGLWERRCRQINDFERYLLENGIHVLKFFLNLSREEQRRRLLERIERPEKRWKFSASDVEERGFWDEHMEAYEEAFRRTSTEWAPWHIIPADSRWFARAAVASAVASKLKSLHAEYPEPSPEQERELDEARKALEEEGADGKARRGRRAHEADAR